MTRRLLIAASLVAALALAGCGGEPAQAAPRLTFVDVRAEARLRDSLAEERADSVRRSRPGYVIDSAIAPEEALRRFRADLGEAPTRFTGGARTREALAGEVLGALARRDTTALRGVLLTRAEFAWLVYPSSPFALPPYRQPPALQWMQLARGRGPALGRLLERLGGRSLALDSLRCDAQPAVEGKNRLWRNCRTSYVLDRKPVQARLFGVVVERDGRFKLASFENDY